MGVFVMLLLSMFTATTSLLNSKHLTKFHSYRNSCNQLCQSNRNQPLFDENVPQKPCTSSSTVKSSITQLGKVAATALGTLFVIPSKSSKTSVSNAIGNLYELQKQNIVIQDIAFNVPDGQAEFDALNALCLNTLKILRRTKTATATVGISTPTSTSASTINDSNVPSLITVVGFGPDQYNNPSTFHPGVSTFYEDGGHATLTFKSPLPSTTTSPTPSIQVSDSSPSASSLISTTPATSIVNKRYGFTDAEVKFVKIGTEVLRLSKGIEKGMVVKYAYGWIDLESPGGVPYEVILGLTRDPIMMCALEVSDLQKSEQFYTSVLGMKKIPFPLARDAASQYEPKQPVKPVKSVHLGYGPDSLSLLLIEKNSGVNNNKNFFGKLKSPSTVGNSNSNKGGDAAINSTINRKPSLLDSLTLVFDDTLSIDTMTTTSTSTTTSSTNETTELPAIFQSIISNKKDSDNRADSSDTSSNSSNSSGSNGNSSGSNGNSSSDSNSGSGRSNSNIVYSPDGLKIILKPYSLFNRNRVVL